MTSRAECLAPFTDSQGKEDPHAAQKMRLLAQRWRINLLQTHAG